MNRPARILIVDDEEQIRSLIAVIVETEGFQFKFATDGESALTILDEEPFDLMISDINMTGMTGVELLAQCKNRHVDLAVIMVTGVNDQETAIKTLEMGAYGYVTKPFTRDELVINMANALRRRQLEIDNRRHSQELERRVRERTSELEQSYQETILILTRAAEFRDNETAKHTDRMGKYCETLAHLLGEPEAYYRLLRDAAPLHDVGKIGIPDSILLKPGKLTTEEFDIVKTHCVIGHRILSESHSKILRLGAQVALTHHEKYDGSGYPNGLAGQDIPLCGRIAAVCDVFDALTHKRVYKDAMSDKEALMILKDGRGSHFDPHILDTFLGNIDRIQAIRSTMAD